MSFRITASVISLAVIAYACGPRARAEADATVPLQQANFSLASMSSGAPLGSISAPAAARSLVRSLTHERSLKKETGKLDATFDVTQRDGAVEFAFHVRNASGRRVEVKFPSGQAYDFVVVDSIGREVWRWANGRIFTQSVQGKLLGDGDSISIAERWEKARTGKFRAIAVLHSTNFPVQQVAEFERK
jgi:hypothetical protein